MPFRKPNSPFWKIRKKHLPGYGDSGTLSTRVKSKRLALKMEDLLTEIAEAGLLDERYHLLLDALKPTGRGRSGPITLPDLLKAKSSGRLPDLLLKLEDPPLSSAIDAFLLTVPDKTGSDKRIRRAMNKLLGHAPLEHEGAPTTLGYLRDPRHITLLANLEFAKGKTRNSVQVTFLSPLSVFLTHHYGKAERDRIFASVRWSWEDDTRDVYLSPGEIARLLEACSLDYMPETRPRQNDASEMRAIVTLALATGADRTPIATLKCRDVTLVLDKATGQYQGTIYVRDTKTKNRSRTAPIGHQAALELLPYLSDTTGRPKLEGTRLFTLTPKQVTYYFGVARRKASLNHVRFKDLRSQFAIYADRAGLTQATAQGAMGHAQASTTRRYKRYETTMSSSEASAVEHAMGLSKTHEVAQTG